MTTIVATRHSTVREDTMKHIMKLFVTLVMMFAGLAFVAQTANAATATATGDSSGTEIVSSESTASTTTQASAESVNGVSIHSSTQVVSYIQASGATRKQMHAKKFKLKRAMTIWTSYYNVYHQEVWHLKRFPKGKVFVWGHDGWWHDPICWNKEKIRTPKKVPAKRKLHGAIKVVSSFTFQAGSTSAVSGEATAQAHAWCTTSSSGADAYGTGHASFAASAYASAQGRTWAEAKANASAASAGKLKLQAGTETDIKIRLKTQAEGNATAEASAKVTCSSPPAPAPTMSLVLDKPNDIDQSIANPGGSTDWSFTQTLGHATAPTGAGDVTYTVRAKYGFVKFVTANSPCQTTGLHDNVVTTITQPSGTYDLTLCYIASTEDPATYGGSDPITLTAVFAGQTYTDTQSITVNPTPQPPL